MLKKSNKSDQFQAWLYEEKGLEPGGERDREGERGRGKPSSEIGKEKGLSLQPLQTLGNNNGKF